MSEPPPAENGVNRRIGFDGYASAAMAGMTAQTSAAATNSLTIFIFPSFFKKLVLISCLAPSIAT
jgi:hypothetical protein